MLPKETHTVIWASDNSSLAAKVSSRTTAMALVKEAIPILIDEPLLKAREPVL